MTVETFPPLSRRAAFGLAGGLMSGGALAAETARGPTAAIARGLDFSNPQDVLNAKVKTIGSLESGAQTFHYMIGTVFAVFDDGARLDPLFGVSGAFAIRTVRESDAVWRQMVHQVITYFDLAGGQAMERWRNPYSGETVEVVNFGTRMDSQLIARDERLVETKTSRVKQWWAIEGTQAVQYSELQSRKPNPITPEKFPRESSGAIYVKNQNAQRRADYAALSDPSRPSVPYTEESQRFGPWYPWMLMGQAKGRLFNQLHQGKVDAQSQIPGPAVAYAAKHFPQFLEAPKEWTGEFSDPETWWAANRKPAPPKAP
jgi:hypothetical protein